MKASWSQQVLFVMTLDETERYTDFRSIPTCKRIFAQESLFRLFVEFQTTLLHFVFQASWLGEGSVRKRSSGKFVMSGRHSGGTLQEVASCIMLESKQLRTASETPRLAGLIPGQDAVPYVSAPLGVDRCTALLVRAPSARPADPI